MLQNERTPTEVSESDVSNRIYILRGCPVMMDNDLAKIYEVDTKILKKAVRRNIERFPVDFMFEPSDDELKLLRFQIGTSNSGQENIVQGPTSSDNSENNLCAENTNSLLRIQIGTSKLMPKSLRFRSGTSNADGENRGGNRYTPFVFTEPGVAMLSSVLHSNKAIQTNVSIIRTFIQLRSRMMMSYMEIAPKLDSMQQSLDALHAKFSCPQSIQNSPALDRDKVKLIQNAVAQHWGLCADDLKSPTRTKAISLARQVAIFLIRKYLGLGFNEIGDHFGQRDHTTILHAYRKIHVDCEDNVLVRNAIASIQSQIQLA